MGENRETDEGETPQAGGGQAGARAEREARLAKALRDNLRRRKAPARQGEEPPPGRSRPR